MARRGTSGGRGLAWPVVLAVLGAALVSLPALAPAEGPVRAEDRREGIQQIPLERSTGPDFEQKLVDAVNREGGFESQIVGGTPVSDGKYLFMAVLVIENIDGSTALCGGSLIDPDSVLTAAHCVLNARSVDVAVGRTVLSQNQGQQSFATMAAVHPRFNPGVNFSNDAAVLQLGSTVTGIKPVSLATGRQDSLETPGRALTVAGWGTTSEGGRASDRMREVSVPVVSDATAQRAYTSRHYVRSLMVAAGERGRDACQGDSGGPLFKPGATRTQVGIVSFGRGCARAAFPGVYTEVNSPGIRTFILNAAQQ